MQKRISQLILIALIALPSASHAASGERIVNFNSAIRIDKESTADITETIQYDFGTTPKHGIYRIVPTSYVDENDKYYATTAKLADVTLDETAVNRVESSSVDGVSWKIGDANKTVSGVHTYRLHYTLAPILMLKGANGFLNLNITGTGWTVPIEHVAATVTLTGSPTITHSVCFSGAKGSDDQSNCSVDSMDNQIIASAGPLAAGEGLTLNSDLNADYSGTYLVGGAKPEQPTPWGMIIFFAIMAIPFLGGSALLAYIVGSFINASVREWRQKKAQVIVAQYDPPEGWLPAEIGLLDENISNMREITATLIDLAVRGYIRIEQTTKGGMLKKAKYRINQLKDYGDANDYEQVLLGALFDHPKAGLFESVKNALSGDGGVESTTGMKSVAIDDVDTTYMAKVLTEISKNLKDRLVQRGTYPAKAGFIKNMTSGSRLTATGIQQWAYTEGFKEYLKVVEKDRLKFTDAPDKTPERFSKLLPYAIALGVEEEWAKQFEGIDIAQNANWYASPYGTFTALALTQDLHNNFAASVSSNLAPPSSSSSMSSSGGSSGGGTGGGGGGSW